MCLIQKIPSQTMPDPVAEEKKRVREADEVRRRMFAGRGWDSTFGSGATGLGDIGAAIQRITLGA